MTVHEVLNGLGDISTIAVMIFVGVRYAKGWRLRWHEPEKKS